MSASKEATETKTLRVVMTKEEYDRFRDQAAAEFRSPSKQIRFLIAQYTDGGESTWSQ